MPNFYWHGGMWIVPFVMMIGMFVMAFLVCGRGARRVFGHTVFGNRRGPGEDPLEILPHPPQLGFHLDSMDTVR